MKVNSQNDGPVCYGSRFDHLAEQVSGEYEAGNVCGRKGN